MSVDRCNDVQLRIYYNLKMWTEIVQYNESVSRSSHDDVLFNLMGRFNPDLKKIVDINLIRYAEKDFNFFENRKFIKLYYLNHHAQFFIDCLKNECLDVFLFDVKKPSEVSFFYTEILNFEICLVKNSDLKYSSEKDLFLFDGKFSELRKNVLSDRKSDCNISNDAREKYSSFVNAIITRPSTQF